MLGMYTGQPTKRQQRQLGGFLDILGADNTEHQCATNPDSMGSAQGLTK